VEPVDNRLGSNAEVGSESLENVLVWIWVTLVGLFESKLLILGEEYARFFLQELTVTQLVIGATLTLARCNIKVNAYSYIRSLERFQLFSVIRTIIRLYAIIFK